MTTSVVLRNGDILRINDEVATTFHRTCEGKVFVVCAMTQIPNCESGVMVLAHLKGDPERKLGGTTGKGIDANWFQPVGVTKID